MSPPSRSDDYKYRKSWGPSTRLNVTNRIRAIIADEQGLNATSEAVAEEMMALFVAEACSISLLDESGYRDIVNLGSLAPGDKRFPGPDFRYPARDFPLSTELLLKGTGYISANARSDLYKEYQGMWPQMPAGSFMGVPIVASGQVGGEVYLARGAKQPPFSSEDLDVARDLATPYGSALPRLLALE